MVRIVRELDRYHGFVAAGRRARLPHELGKMSGEAQQMGCGKQECDGDGLLGRPCNPASVEAAGHTPSGPTARRRRASLDVLRGRLSRQSRGVPPAARPQMAPQALEKMESAPDNSALPHAFEAAPPAAEPARSVPADDLEAGPPKDALPPAAEPPQCDPAPAASGAGAQTAPQAVENYWFRARKRQDPGRRRVGRGSGYFWHPGQ